LETRTQVTTDHPILCPVKLWCEVYRRVSSIDTASAETPVNTWYNPISKKVVAITATKVITLLRKTCDNGGGQLVFGADLSSTPSFNVNLTATEQAVLEVQWCWSLFQEVR
jgi:hypothetical protein